MRDFSLNDRIVGAAPATDTSRSVVVMSDSLAIVDEKGVHKFTSPRLYPAQLAERLEAATGLSWRPVVFARGAWSLYWGSREIPNRDEIVAALRDATVVVIGLASTDAQAIATPRGFGITSKAGSVYRTPRRVSRLHHYMWRFGYEGHAVLVKLTGKRFRHTPPRALAASFESLLRTIRRLNPEAAIVCVLPTRSHQRLFGGHSPHVAAVRSELLVLAARHGVPTVDLAAIVGEWKAELPDGSHWPTALHRRVADAMAAAVVGYVTEPRARTAG